MFNAWVQSKGNCDWTKLSKERRGNCYDNRIWVFIFLPGWFDDRHSAPPTSPSGMNTIYTFLISPLSLQSTWWNIFHLAADTRFLNLPPLHIQDWDWNLEGRISIQYNLIEGVILFRLIVNKLPCVILSRIN